MIDNIKSKLILDFKSVEDDGAITQMIVWQLPRPVPPCLHDMKYRLVYVVNGERVVGFDNERGKGNHAHVAGQELAYEFVNLDQLVEDFLAAIEHYKRHHGS